MILYAVYKFALFVTILLHYLKFWQPFLHKEMTWDYKKIFNIIFLKVGRSVSQWVTFTEKRPNFWYSCKFYLTNESSHLIRFLANLLMLHIFHSSVLDKIFPQRQSPFISVKPINLHTRFYSTREAIRLSVPLVLYPHSGKCISDNKIKRYGVVVA